MPWYVIRQHQKWRTRSIVRCLSSSGSLKSTHPDARRGAIAGGFRQPVVPAKAGPKEAHGFPESPLARG